MVLKEIMKSNRFTAVKAFSVLSLAMLLTSCSMVKTIKDMAVADKSSGSETADNQGTGRHNSGSSIGKLYELLNETENSYDMEVLTGDSELTLEEYSQILEDDLDTISDHRMRLGDIGTLPDNVSGAAESYYDLLEAGMKNMKSDIDFTVRIEEMSELFEEYIDYEGEDEEDYYNVQKEFVGQFNEWYEDVDCPDYLKESWAELGEGMTVYDDCLERYAEAVNYDDVLRMQSAQNFYQRGITQISNELGNIADKLLPDNINFAISQCEEAESIFGEFKNLMELDEDAIAAYKFKSDPEGKLLIEYDAVESIYPALYNSYDQFLIIRAGCVCGEKDIVVEAEIPELTQSFMESYHIGSSRTTLYIKPAAIGGAKVDKARDLQMNVKVKESNGNLIEAKTFKIHQYTVNDFRFFDDEFGYVTADNLLCYLTPSNIKITELKKAAVEEMMGITDGYMDAFAGYQNMYGAEEGYEYINTYLQAAGLMMALTDMKVRYIMDPFSYDAQAQHILLPQQVLEQKGGLCVETALVVASALQSAGMHTFIVMPEGHAQVAVETWDGAGDYFLIETTALSMDDDIYVEYADYIYSDEGYLSYDEEDYPIRYVSNEEWEEIIAADESYYVLDCSDGQTLGLTPFEN